MASPRAKFVAVLEEKPQHWWTEWLESRGVYPIVLQAALCELAQEGNLVYHGRAGQELLPGIRHVLNVFVDTPTASRIQQVMTRKGLSEETAREHLEELDRIRARRLKELFKIDWRDPTRYDFVLNTARMSVETAARFIAEVSQRQEYRPTAGVFGSDQGSNHQCAGGGDPDYFARHSYCRSRSPDSAWRSANFRHPGVGGLGEADRR